MTEEKINFIEWRVCEGESPCICIPDFKCPYLDKNLDCILIQQEKINDEEIIEQCHKAFIEWLKEE